MTLFARSGRRLELTEAGERVYTWAAETLARTRTLMREVRGLDDGHAGAAVLAASMSIGSYVLPAVLSAFRRERPAAQLTLAIREPEAVLRSVEQGECDFAIAVLDHAPRPGRCSRRPRSGTSSCSW